ncbi:MAG: class I SAM-dependent methyltransferase [Candidatus Gracilibacteria bacterium]|nr:class I SAM-dependent methyltransferase [Candidatus Gracilibacteria bacterium]
MTEKYSYYQTLLQQYDPKTFKRKQDYFEYNYSKQINFRRDMKVLEFGPGIGEFVDYLNKKGVEDITVVDNDDSILDNISDKYKISKKLRLISGIDDIKEGLLKYDLIVLTQVLEHIPVNVQEDFLRYLYSILNIDGKIIITVPNANNFIGVTERYWDFTHMISYTSNSLIQLCQKAGVKRSEINLRPYSIPPYEIINIPRIMLQKILYFVIYGIYMINGGIYSNILTPNITCVIKKG